MSGGKSQIPTRFALLPAVFECTEVHPPQKDLNTTPYMLMVYSQVPNFTPLHSTTSQIHITGHFEKVHRLTQNDLEDYKVKRTPTD